MKKVALIAILALLFVGCEKKKEEHTTIQEPVKESKIKITQNVVKEQKKQKKALDKGEFYYSYNEASNASL